MNITSVRLGIVAAIQSGINVTGLTVLSAPAESAHPPVFMVGEVSFLYDSQDRTFGSGLLPAIVTCRVLISGDSQVAIETLDDLFSGEAGSVQAALELDTTLGGVCSDLVVVRAEWGNVYQYGSDRYLGGDITVQVI